MEFMPKGAPRQSIDERIEQIESARFSLVEALDAIDELKLAAERNKLELAATLQTLAVTQTQSASAEKELETVRELAKERYRCLSEARWRPLAAGSSEGALHWLSPRHCRLRLGFSCMVGS